MSFLFGSPSPPQAAAVPVAPSIDPTAIAAQQAAATAAEISATKGGRASTTVAGNQIALDQEQALQAKKKVGAASSTLLGGSGSY